jgi:hypothetical protein
MTDKKKIALMALIILLFLLPMMGVDFLIVP